MVDTFLLAKSFVTLLVITDPVGTVPIFLAITAEWGARERNRAAWQAVLVAGLVIATFALFGQQILLYLDISLPSLQAAGGLLLLVVALELLRGEVGGLAGGSATNIAFVPLGTPLLAGPGAIAAVMVFARQADRPAEQLGVALGLVGVLAVLYLSLRFSGLLLRLLRQAGVDLITRISGLLLTAIAVELIVDATREFVRLGV
jgi:multiple antibiotic resistance protein